MLCYGSKHFHLTVINNTFYFFSYALCQWVFKGAGSRKLSLLKSQNRQIICKATKKEGFKNVVFNNTQPSQYIKKNHDKDMRVGPLKDLI